MQQCQILRKPVAGDCSKCGLTNRATDNHEAIFLKTSNATLLNLNRRDLLPTINYRFIIMEIIMPTTHSTTTRKSPAPRTTTRRSKHDAIKLLTDDHAKVKKMFKEFEKLCKKNEDEGKGSAGTKICKELTIHGAVGGRNILSRCSRGNRRLTTS